MLMQLNCKLLGLGSTFVLLCLLKQTNKQQRVHNYLVLGGDGTFKEKEKQTQLNKEGEGYL